jgi:ABC-2 type transport system permease protein
MRAMLRKSLWELRWTTLWFALGGVLYTGAILAYFPYVRDNVATFSEAMKSYPESMVKFFGIADIGSFTGFLGTYVMNVMWPLLAAAFAITVGSAVVAREVETGTAELWLSVPASRVRLLLGKLTAVALAVLAMVGSAVATVVAGALAASERPSVLGLAGMALEMFAFVLAVAAVSALISAITSDRGRAVGIALGITGVSYLAGVVAVFSADWSWIKYLSLFTAFQPVQTLRSGSIDVGGLVVLVVVAAVASAGALLAFSRRDAIA